MEVLIGSRKSKLAIWQSRQVYDYIQEQCQGYEPNIVTMTTKGDQILDRPLYQVGGKGLFVKELEHSLLQGEIDMAVHSLKDVPSKVLAEIPLIGYSKREDARDALVLPADVTKLDLSKPIACSSSRRILQLQRLMPKAQFVSIRGNVETRLNRLDQGEYAATILAVAGLKRLGLEHRISHIFSVEEMVPSAGQGILAVQGRSGQDYSYLEGFFDQDARDMALCERSFVATLQGGCTTPAGAYASIEQERMHLLGFYYNEKNGKQAYGCLDGKRKEAASMGRFLAEQLLKECE